MFGCGKNNHPILNRYRIKQMKQIFLLIALSTAFAFTANCQSLIPEAKLLLILPNSQWPALTRELVGKRILYSFKRMPIIDKSGRKVIPNIGITLESIPENIDLKTFSSALLEDLQTASTQDKQPLRVLNKYHFGGIDRIISAKNMLGYKANYQDENSINHLVYVIYIVNNNFGIQAIFDTTAELFPKCSPEFLKTIRAMQTLIK